MLRALPIAVVYLLAAPALAQDGAATEANAQSDAPAEPASEGAPGPDADSDGESAPEAEAEPAKAATSKAAAEPASEPESTDDADEGGQFVPGNPALMAARGRRWIFRGSSVRFRNLLAARSLLPNFEQTYNPYFANAVQVAPQAWWGNTLTVGGFLAVSREWTWSDFNTFQGETELSDLWLSAAAVNFYTIPYLGIGMSASVAGRLPTSKWSWGQTMLGSTQGTFSLFRFFQVLGGFTLGYSFTGGKFFHRFTTGENATSRESGGCITTEVCGIWASNGIRNPEWFMTNRVFTQFLFTNWLGVAIDGRVTSQRLYPINKIDPELIGYFPGYSFEDGSDLPNVLRRYQQDQRHWIRVVTSAFVTPHPSVTFFVGTDTAHPQLGPNGQYRIPGFNRFTILYADMQINSGGLANLFVDDGLLDFGLFD